ncbi:MAG: aromatic ring-hydroxylating dioxygenase subunit alpha [Fimbriimonadaceae bacterium]
MSFDINPDITEAWTPPTSFYGDAVAFERSKEAIFAKSWQWITDVESVKVPGQVFPFTMLDGFLDEPLMFSRDRNDQLHCLSNVCTHRGNIVCEGASNLNSFRCRYHGRRFALDGTFQSMPEFEGVRDFPQDCDNLAKVPMGEWNGHLFASIDPAVSFETVFSPMFERVGFLPLRSAKYAPSRAREYLIKCHWSLYVDNYLEGFHIPYIHAALNETLDYSSYGYELLDHGVLQLGIGKGADDFFDLPTDSPDYGQNVSAYYYWFFPNLMFNFYPWGLSINVIRPLASGLTKVNFIPYVWDESKLGRGAGADLDRVEREDEAVVEMVQRGMASRFYKRGRYAPKGEQATHHFHQILARTIR